MNELSKEELAAACAEKVKNLEFAVAQSAFGDVRQELDTELAIARVALAALRERDKQEPAIHRYRRVSVEPYGPYPWHYEDFVKYPKPTEGIEDEYFYAWPPAPVVSEFIPKNLDKALAVVGVALPESKEEFNFQIERWTQRLIDRVIRYADEFRKQPAPVVPDIDRKAICNRVHQLCSRSPGATFYTAAEYTLDEVAKVQTPPAPGKEG